MSDRSAGPAALLALACAACGATVPHGGAPLDADSTTVQPPGELHLAEAHDLIPADLDLVLRIDLGMMRDNLGPEAQRELTERAFEQAGDSGLMRHALEQADIAWIGLRVADFETGDRVLVVKRRGKALEPDPIAWSSKATGTEGLRRFEALSDTPRSGTAEILLFGERAAMFISPVETPSVARVLRRGPDAKRGQPAARGLLSLDYRARRLSPSLENQYPSLAALIAGIEHIRATVDVSGRRLDLEGRIQCRGAKQAARVMRFLTTVRDSGKQRPRLAALFDSLKLERTDRTVELSWPLPQEAIAVLLKRGDPASGGGPPAPTPPPPAAPAPPPPAAPAP